LAADVARPLVFQFSGSCEIWIARCRAAAANPHSGCIHTSHDRVGRPISRLSPPPGGVGTASGCSNSHGTIALARVGTSEARSLRRPHAAIAGTLSNGLWWHGVTSACRPADQPAVPPLGGIRTASGCSNSHGTAALARVGTSKHARSDGSCRDPGTVSNGLWWHGVTSACRPADQPAVPPPDGVRTASGWSYSHDKAALARVGTWMRACFGTLQQRYATADT
jgi:hypothetical protein